MLGWTFGTASGRKAGRQVPRALSLGKGNGDSWQSSGSDSTSTEICPGMWPGPVPVGDGLERKINADFSSKSAGSAEYLEHRLKSFLFSFPFLSLLYSDGLILAWWPNIRIRGNATSLLRALCPTYNHSISSLSRLNILEGLRVVFL